ncbi:MAG: type VII toxin-antitoxin system HepT family RNase toxin [Thermodesulfovibrionales bacterium]
MQRLESVIKKLAATVTERVGYLRELSEDFQNLTAFKKADHKTMSAIERDLQVAIEACVDIGKLIISEKRLRPPESMRDVCQVLYENGYIDSKTLKIFEGMVGMRNILVHRYEKIDTEVIYGVLKRHLDDFQRFVDQVMKKLQAED